MATIDGHLDRVRHAIAQGGNIKVTFPTYQGISWCLLTIAAHMGKAHLLALFLELGLPVEGCCTDNHTPLMHAAGMGFVDIVNMLLENGADPLAQNEDGKPCDYGVGRWFCVVTSRVVVDGYSSDSDGGCDDEWWQ